MKKFVLFALLFVCKPIFGEMLFDGTEDYLQLPTITIASTMTFTCWFNVTSTAINQSFISENVAGTPCRIGPITTRKLIIRLVNGGAFDSSSVTIPALNRWTHLAVTRDLNGIEEAYIDGGAAISLHAGSANPGNIVFKVIGRTDATQPYSGKMDDVRLYNRKLSKSEIESLAFSRSRLPITDGLLAWWKLDDGTDGQSGIFVSGSTCIKDSSGNGKHAQPGGSGVEIVFYGGSEWISNP